MLAVRGCFPVGADASGKPIRGVHGNAPQKGERLAAKRRRAPGWERETVRLSPGVSFCYSCQLRIAAQRITATWWPETTRLFLRPGSSAQLRGVLCSGSHRLPSRGHRWGWRLIRRLDGARSASGTSRLSAAFGCVATGLRASGPGGCWLGLPSAPCHVGLPSTGHTQAEAATECWQEEPVAYAITPAALVIFPRSEAGPRS